MKERNKNTLKFKGLTTETELMKLVDDRKLVEDIITTITKYTPD